MTTTKQTYTRGSHSKINPLFDVSVIKKVLGADIRRQKQHQKTKLLSSLYAAPQEQAAISTTAQKRAGKSCSGEINLRRTPSWHQSSTEKARIISGLFGEGGGGGGQQWWVTETKGSQDR